MSIYSINISNESGLPVGSMWRQREKYDKLILAALPDTFLGHEESFGSERASSPQANG